jgi:hypothetical protein
MSRILTIDNELFDMNNLPDEIEDMRYGVLDYSDPNNVDYMFVPLVFLESFNAPSAVMRIGKHQFQMPLDWSIIIGEPDIGEPEIIPIMSLNDRGFKAFVLNPLTAYMPKFETVEIINVYPEIKWFFPKLKYGHLLTVPLCDGLNPPCAYFVKETQKLPEVLALHQLF